MPVSAGRSSSAHGWVLRAATAAAFAGVLLASSGSRSLRADDQVVTGSRGSLSVHGIDRRMQIVEWVGPGSPGLALPKIDPHRWAFLSLRVVPKGLGAIGMIAALTPTWGLDLSGVPLNDDDFSFLVKRCRSLGFLRLRHTSKLANDELADLTDDERAALNSRALTGEGLSKIERLKRLMVLEISGYDLPAGRLEFLSELQELRWLSLCDTPITDEDLRALAHLPKLMRLDLSGTKVTGSGLRYLSECPALQSVMLNRAPLSQAIVATLKEHPLPHLQQLHVHGCKLSRDQLIALRNAVPMFASVIDSSDFSLQKVAAVTPPAPCTPQEVRAYRAACQVLWGFDIAAFSSTQNTVTSLSLRPQGWAPVGDWVVAYLAPFRGLKNLWLHGCNLSPEALDQLQAHDQLEWLDLSHSQLDDAGLARLVSLKRLRGLNLSETKLTDSAARSLAAFANVETLHLSGTQITDQALLDLRFKWRVRMLDLSKCRITNAGAESLSQTGSLEYLRLDDTQVTDRGLRAVANLHSLKGLSCVNCKITDEGADKLLRVENLAYCRLEGTAISKSLRTMLEDHVTGVRQSLRRGVRLPSSSSRSADELWNLDEANSSTQHKSRY
jgi:internalin A